MLSQVSKSFPILPTVFLLWSLNKVLKIGLCNKIAMSFFLCESSLCERSILNCKFGGKKPRIFQNLENISHIFGLCMCEEYSA